LRVEGEVVTRSTLKGRLRLPFHVKRRKEEKLKRPAGAYYGGNERKKPSETKK